MRRSALLQWLGDSTFGEITCNPIVEGKRALTLSSSSLTTLTGMAVQPEGQLGTPTGDVGEPGENDDWGGFWRYETLEEPCEQSLRRSDAARLRRCLDVHLKEKSRIAHPNASYAGMNDPRSLI